ncbi:hypothetical protein HDU67_000345 [Dinochytrium kinnereticum]|nr:hypothetical protein HDU67_000345 [Dinochytrium kinnereticum]
MRHAAAVSNGHAVRDEEEIASLAAALASTTTLAEEHAALKSPCAKQRENTTVSIPTEVLLLIFSNLLPSSTSASSASTSSASLCACSLVCHQWHSASSSLLYNTPHISSLSVLESLIRSLCPPPSGLITTVTDTTVRGSVTTTSTSRHIRCIRESGHEARTVAPPRSLIRNLALSASLVESQRHAPGLSTLLGRLLAVPGVSLEGLDLGFCKGVSNFALQRLFSSSEVSDLFFVTNGCGDKPECCPLVEDFLDLFLLISLRLTADLSFILMGTRPLHYSYHAYSQSQRLSASAAALSTLTALNLSGGGRTEICVIQIATSCPLLKRLGLAWNLAVGDFAVSEIARLCPRLEWLDLSGCARVSDKALHAVALHLGDQSRAKRVGEGKAAALASAVTARRRVGLSVSTVLEPTSGSSSPMTSPSSWVLSPRTVPTHALGFLEDAATPFSSTTPSSIPSPTSHLRAATNRISSVLTTIEDHPWPPGLMMTLGGMSASPSVTSPTIIRSAWSDPSLSSTSQITEEESLPTPPSTPRLSRRVLLRSQSSPSAKTTTSPSVTVDAPHEENRRKGRLRHMNLGHCVLVTDVGVSDLLDRCGRSLVSVNVVGCPDVLMGVERKKGKLADGEGQEDLREVKGDMSVLVRSWEFEGFWV